MPLSSVLGAQSLVRPGVCTSSTRPASPFEGQVIYETDTDLVQVYNGSGWYSIGRVTASTNGAVLQVVSATYSTQVISSTTTYADTGLTATITPSSTSSKILVSVSHPSNYKNPTSSLNAMAMRLVRGSTTISQMSVYNGYTAIADTLYFAVSHVYLDSPSTTSATTYKTTFANNRVGDDVRVQSDNTQSSIVLMEIAG